MRSTWTPDFAVLIDGQSITDKIRRRLISLKTTDKAGFKSDAVQITINDPHQEVAPPLLGVTLQISIGWKEAGLVEKGLYKVDKLGLVEGTGSGRITIEAKAADLTGGLKAQAARNWDATTLGAIINDIARINGLTAAVHPALASIALGHEDQDGESDIHFLTRLLSAHGGTFKITDKRILAIPAGAGVTASGAIIPTATVHKSELIGDVTVDWTLRDDHGDVKAPWRNPNTGEIEYESATEASASDRPTATLRQTFASQAEAKSAARAELSNRARGRATLAMKLWGRPDLVAEQPISLTGCRPGVAGIWTLSSVENELVSDGLFTTSVRSEPPETKKGGDDDLDVVANARR